MRRLVATCLAAVALALCAAATASAQAPYSPPRTADGHPDLGGVWAPKNDLALESGDNAGPAAAGAPRTSLVIDPPDGKLPYRDRASAMVWRGKYGGFVMGVPVPEFTLGPEALPNRDRCLMAANAAAPPMTSQGYNDAYEIVQTPAYVVIAVEMMDEARIIPVFKSASEAAKAHRPKALPRWAGDSVGWWEGDTFVVETENVDPRQGAQSPMPTTPNAMVLERFTRVGEADLLYRADVTDLTLYTRPWTIEFNFRPTGRMWEYACHEGNYGMAGILSGARKMEQDRASARPTAMKPK